MFTFKKEGEDVILKCEVGGTIIAVRPEDETIIWDVDIDAEKFRFDADCSNGTFSLSWDDKFISFEVSKYGGGDAGSITVDIPATSESMMSLRSVLRGWSSLIKPLFENEDRDPVDLNDLTIDSILIYLHRGATRWSHISKENQKKMIDAGWVSEDGEITYGLIK